MRKEIIKVLARVCACSLALSMLAPFTSDSSSAEAAGKPVFKKKTVSVKKGKTAKLTLKGKKIKKTKWSVKNKKIVKLSAKKKESVKVKGLKAGTTKVTAKVTAGKKKYTIKATVKVKKAGPNTTKKTVATPTPANNTKGTGNTTSGAPVSTPTPSATPALDPTPTPAPVHTFPYKEDFENGLGAWVARYNPDETEAKLSISTEAHEGEGASLITGRVKSWNGQMLDLSNSVVGGGKYKISLWAKVPADDTKYAKGINVFLSGVYQVTEDDPEQYFNYPADTYYKIKSTEWTQIEVEVTIPDAFSKYIFYVETRAAADASFLLDDVSIECLSLPAQFDPKLDSIKDTYSSYIGTMGVATSYSELLNKNTMGFIKHHFNSITIGNGMKLDALMSKDTYKLTDAEAAGYVTDAAYAACADNKDAEGNVLVPAINFTEMDKVLKLAKENGLKVRVHAPFWHQQNPQIFFTKQFGTGDNAEYTDQETMLVREEMFVRTLLNHIFKSGYGDVVSAYDVVNEYTHMTNEGGQHENYWKYIFGTEFNINSPYVKKAFAVAYDELVKNQRTDISLIYNDYNTYDNPDQIVTLINNINKKDDLNPAGNKICSGIGMQSHINDSGSTPERYEAAIEKFKDAGFEIQITELDVTNTGTVTSDSTEEQKASVWAKNAEAYGNIMNVILKQKAAGANITSVTVWGITDAGSWRPKNAPLLFGDNLADKKPSFDAFINAAKNFGK